MFKLDFELGKNYIHYRKLLKYIYLKIYENMHNPTTHKCLYYDVIF